MNNYSNILLCSDLDGTLINSNGGLSYENRQAIKDLMQGGGKFCLATGRLPSHLLNFFEKSDLECPVICCNGACIYDFSSDKILYECHLGNKIGNVIEYIAENTNNVNAMYCFEDLQRHDLDIDKLRDSNISRAYKAVLVMDNPNSAIEMRNILNECFGADYSFSRSWSVGLEILNINATKGKTVQRIKDILGDDRVSVCVGDYENDISMIKMADIGCAVDNAVSELKAVADRIVCSNDDNAIRYILDNILSEN